MTSPESQETRITRLEERLDTQRSQLTILWGLVGITFVALLPTLIIAITAMSITSSLGKAIETQGQMIQTLTDVVLPR